MNENSSWVNKFTLAAYVAANGGELFSSADELLDWTSSLLLGENRVDDALAARREHLNTRSPIIGAAPFNEALWYTSRQHMPELLRLENRQF
jgi:hypothetical protein